MKWTAKRTKFNGTTYTSEDGRWLILKDNDIWTLNDTTYTMTRNHLNKEYTVPYKCVTWGTSAKALKEECERKYANK